jgi:hypothetical protein
MVTETPSTKRSEDEQVIKGIVVTVRNWNKFLWSKLPWILGIALSCGILGFTYATIKKPIYTATTTFVLEENGSAAFGNLGGLASMIGVDIGGGGGGLFSGDNILELYKSRNMIQKTLLTKTVFDNSNELLIDRFIKFNKLESKWDETDWTKINFNNPTRLTVLQDSVLGEVVNEINRRTLSVTKPDKKLSIIKVDVNSKDQKFAKAFADIIVMEVNRFYVDTKTKRSLDNVKILQHKTDSVRRVMNGAINTAAAVADATPNLNITRQAQRTAPIQRSQFSAETNKAVLSELVKNLEISKMNLLKETPLIQVIDRPIYPLERTKPSKLIYSFLGFFLGMTCTAILLIVRKILNSI